MGYWKVGNRITAARANRLTPIAAYKLANAPFRASTTTPAPDPELKVELVPSTSYVITSGLMAFSAADSAGDIAIRWAWTNNMVVGMMGVGSADVITTGSQADAQTDYFSNNITSPSGTVTYGTTANGTTILARAIAHVGNLGGVLTLEWAQQTSNVNGTSLRINSWICATPVIFN